MILRAEHVFTGRELLRDHVVELGRVRAARVGDPPAEPGLLVPGLVNAHTHVELSGTGLVPGGAGFADWGRRLMATRRADPEATRRAAADLAALGTSVICDVSNRGDTAELLAEAGLVGLVQHEHLGFDPPRVAAALASMAVRDGPVRVVPGVHAPYSTAPDLIRAAVRHDGPASLHVAESEDEVRFLRDGTGPLADLLDELGADWRWWRPPGTSPVGYLAELGVLGPSLLLVHGVLLDDTDRRLLAESGTPLCLCPRSNLHIGGRLPDVEALLAAGVRLCLGTDSLASAPDLDLLAEVALLAEAFPRVPVVRWLEMATTAGAQALRVAPEAWVLLEVDHPDDLRKGPPARRRMR